VIYVILLLVSSFITIVLVTIQINQNADVSFPNITINDLQNVSGTVKNLYLFTSTSEVWWTLIISIATAIINYLFGKLFTQWLTNFEQHYTWTKYKSHHITKYFVFKILNISLLFLMRWIVQNHSNLLFVFPYYAKIASSALQNVKSVCNISSDADQFFFLLIIDFTAIRLVTLFLNWFQFACYGCCHPDLSKKERSRSDKGRPDFDIAEEYLELLYRQYLIYLAIPIFPSVALMALVLGAVEYPLDKFVLLKLSKTPPFLSGSMRSYVVFYMFIIAIAAMFIFPQGIFWVLVGFLYNGNNCVGTIFDLNNGTAYFS